MRKSKRRTILATEPLEPRRILAAGPVVINEFLAVNDGGLADGHGEPSDWIELYNPTDARVSLDGWYLTDDDANLTKWRLPGVQLEADAYLIVFASGKDSGGPPGELHTNFQLDGDGEYLALVRADGTTVAHEFAPEFPRQREDVSYGTSQDAAAFALQGAGLTYRVPTGADANLGTTWTDLEFDDSDWSEFVSPSRVLITEAGPRDPDFVEIQNLAGETVDTAGWVVVANDAYPTGDPPEPDINAWHTTLWNLPDAMPADQLLFRNDVDEPGNQNFWGENLLWSTRGPGWAMLLDDAGNVADFVVWRYTADEIASFDVTVNGHHVTAEGIWSGDAIASDLGRSESLQRGGLTDHDDLSDWSPGAPETMGTQNEDLTVPFAAPRRAGLGFETDPPGLSGEIEIDVASEMHGVNASLWARIPFQVEDPSVLDSLQLRVMYNDGFVAYVNGREVARRNAPAATAWNSNAPAARDEAESLVFEDVDISAHLEQLVPGANVLALHGLNVSAADGDFLLSPEMAATGLRYFDEPTPNGPNGIGFREFVRDTNFSVDRGFYEDPFEVAVTTNTPGATIYYTLDGSPPYLAFEADDPIPTNGVEYGGPLTVAGTTTLRAAAFKRDHLPTNVDTHTYIFVDDVVRQDYAATRAAGLPASWGGVSPDYGMDPDVIGTFDPVTGEPNGDDRYGGIYAATIRDDLKAIPTLSIVLDVDDMFGSNGIYSRSTQSGINWERPTSVELIDPDGSEGFQVDAGIRIQGGWFRRTATKKHSLRLLFKREYGPTKLDYPWFGADAVDRFDTLTLRAGANDGYAWSAARYTEQYTRDEFGRSLQRAAGQVSSHGDFVHLYINGVYWGLYNPVERPDNSFSASYYGGEKENWDSIHDGNAPDGNMSAWNQMISKSQQAAGSNAAFQELQGNHLDGTRNPAYPILMDLSNYLDYMIINLWGGNWDWPNKNYWAGRDRTDASTGFKFYNWDFENTMGNNRSRSPLNMVAPRNTNGTGQMHGSLVNNAEYRLAFADRVHRMFFNDGILTPGSLVPRYAEVAAWAERAMVAESARWGDTEHSTPLTLQEWTNERNWMLGTYLPQRTDIVLQQFINSNLYPSLSAPTFSQHGGQVSIGFDLQMTAPAGTIYYTLNGSDPRSFGGGISPDAQEFTAAPVTLTESTLVKARAWDGGTWSALNFAQFFIEDPAAAANLVITEINYDPYPPTAEEAAAGFGENNDFEFIELRNISDKAILLKGVELIDGILFNFDDGSVDRLAPGESVVVARKPAAVAFRYDAVNHLTGPFGGKLKNEGEQITVLGFFGNTIVDFRYDNGGDWPGRATGKGASLELIAPDTVPVDDPARTAVLENGDNWRGSSEYGGSPGSVGTGPIGDVVVNEVLINTPPPLLDTIELHNTTDQAVDVGGWYLSDSWGWASDLDNGNYKKFLIPDGTTIPPYGYVVFDENDFNDPALAPNDFALDGAHGDDVWLMEADAAGKLTRFVDRVDFGAAAEGESLGRWPNGQGDLYPMITPTLDKTRPGRGANSGPRVGPVIISELHYNPKALEEDDDLEFIELYNGGSTAVELTDWRIRGGIDYDFPAGATLGPYSVLVVAAFDLAETDKLTAFYQQYWPGEPVPGDLFLLGGYSQQLSDEGERVRLQRPDAQSPDDPGFIPRLLEDEARYDNDPPWPAEPDGQGEALHRRATDAWGLTHLSWDARTPTPGATVFLPPDAQIVGRHVFYNNSSFDDNDAGANSQDDAAIAPDKAALMPGRAAALANYTSYSRGINGIMIDVDALPPGAAPGGDDFLFRIGNDDDPTGWTTVEAAPTVTVRRGDGDGGSDRVTIIWPDNTIEKQWLQVTVLAGGDTGLLQDDVFYFGNAIGESGNSASAGETADAKVNVADMLRARENQRNFLNPAPIDFRFDFDRDARVDIVDMLIARNHQTHFLNALKLIALPLVPKLQLGNEAGAVAGASVHDAVFGQAGREESGAAAVELILDPSAGSLTIDTGSQTINGYIVESLAGVFTGLPAANLGTFQTDFDDEISGQMDFTLSGRHPLGTVIGPQWEAFVDYDPLEDFTFTYTLQGTPGIYRGEVVFPEVVGRHVFYNNSIFDTGDDDGAIATDKRALLPGQTATFANYTSYSRGINGIMVDVANSAGAPTAADFEFKFGNHDDPSDWEIAPPPSSVTVRQGAGVGGSDRVTILFNADAVRGQWLQVTVPEGGNLGLPWPDVSYFGNAVGESGNSPAGAKINAFDMLGVRDNQRTFLDPAPIDFPFDYDRNARVDATDMLIARNNTTHLLNALRLITAPGSAQRTGGAEGVSAHDAVWRQVARGGMGSLEFSPGKLAWLHEYCQTTPKKRPSEEDDSIDIPLDRSAGD